MNQILDQNVEKYTRIDEDVEIKDIDEILDHEELDKIMLRLSENDEYVSVSKFFDEDTILSVIRDNNKLHFIVLSYHPMFKIYNLEVWSFRKDGENEEDQ